MASGLKAKIEDIKDSFQRLSPRERGALAALAGTFALLLMLGIGYWISSELAELEDRNEATRQALKDIDRYKDRFLQNKRREAALRRAVSATTLELNSYIEKAASAAGVEIAESSETKPVEGKNYTRRGVDIKLRKVTLGQLVGLLKRLTSSTAHVVQVTELSVMTRWNHHEDLDVELMVSTYDRKQGRGRKQG